MSQRIDKALEQACRVFPFLPYVLKRVDITAKAVGKSYMRWTKDGMIIINIDPKIADTPEKFEFILLHEVGHIIYAAHLFSDDYRWKESHKLVNIAMDMIINETIIDFDSNYQAVNDSLNGFSFKLAKDKLDLDLNLNMTWIEIYDALKPHVKFINIATLIDEHSDNQEEKDSTDEAKEIIDNLLEKPEVADRVKGLNLKDLAFKKAEKLKHEKFKMELSKFLGTLISFDKKNSIMRPNRRCKEAIKGFKKDKKVNALVAVDVSGSITTYMKELQASFSVVLNYCDSVDVMPFNDKLGNLHKNITRMPEFTPGGGTNFHILADLPSKYDVMIVVSDLECDPPTFKENNVIYLSNNTPDWVKGRKHVLL